MSEPEIDPALFMARPAYRKGIFYLTTDADVVAVLTGMGFSQYGAFTPQEKQLLIGLAQVVASMSGVQTSRQVPVGTLRAGDGRLAVVFPSEPRAIIVEIGPAAKVPVLIMPATAT